METCSSETSVDFHWTTWLYIPEDRTLEKLKSNNISNSLIVELNYEN
jgi:hypothetical protein